MLGGKELETGMCARVCQGQKITWSISPQLVGSVDPLLLQHSLTLSVGVLRDCGSPPASLYECQVTNEQDWAWLDLGI